MKADDKCVGVYEAEKKTAADESWQTLSKIWMFACGESAPVLQIRRHWVDDRAFTGCFINLGLP